jgi:predicted XRE-type DNA-binding protein
MGAPDGFLDFLRVDSMPGHMAGVVRIPIETLEAIQHSISIYSFRIYSKARKLTQPQASLLMRNCSGNFSVERLMTFPTALGQDVEITVSPTRKEQGAMSVTLA